MSDPFIVIVEDDATIAELIEFNLHNDGYNTRSFGDGPSMLKALPELPAVSLFVLDIMLPVMDGFEILKRLKQIPAIEAVPVLMLTARSTESDKVRGLSTGADDYLTKPFGIREFLARVETLLRRYKRLTSLIDSVAAAENVATADTTADTAAVTAADIAADQTAGSSTAAAGSVASSTVADSTADTATGKGVTIESQAGDGKVPVIEAAENLINFGPVSIDDARHRVYRDDAEIEMTHREYELLKFLLQNRGIAFSRDELLNAVWGYDYYGETRTVDVHIRQLRRKIELDDSKPVFIETVRGRGYRFTDRLQDLPNDN
ncbi:MAG: response regulator transcription factor [Ruminococcaceae bacterium]|nr:response regulator transcription factor [Oscillospiraceae bacterium]